MLSKRGYEACPEHGLITSAFGYVSCFFLANIRQHVLDECGCFFVRVLILDKNVVQSKGIIDIQHLALLDRQTHNIGVQEKRLRRAVH